MQFLAVPGDVTDPRLISPFAVGVGAVVAGGDEDAHRRVVPHELVELARLAVVRPRLAATPGVRVDAGALQVRIVEERGDVGGDPGQQEPAVALEVSRVPPVQRLLDRLEHQPRLVGDPADRRLAGERSARRSVAEHRPGDVRPMAGIEVGRAVVAARVADVVGEVGRDRVALDRLHPPGEVGVSGLVVPTSNPVSQTATISPAPSTFVAPPRAEPPAHEGRRRCRC